MVWGRGSFRPTEKRKRRSEDTKRDDAAKAEVAETPRTTSVGQTTSRR